MKHSRRLLSAILVFVFILSALVSCAETQQPEETTDTLTSTAPLAAETTIPDETTAYEPDDLKEKYNFNETVTFFIWSDHRMREYYAEDSGDNIDVAIYNRNIKVAERLGIEIKFAEEKGSLDFYKNWNKKIENDWQADNAYDIYSGYSRAIPLLSIKGMTANLLEYDDFNVEKPWWPEALTTECTIKDRLYFCSGDIATSLLWYMDAILYNKELYNSYYLGTPSPMDLVDSNEWTFEKLFSLSKDIYISSPDGVAENCQYGMSVYKTDIDAFQIGAGIISLEKTEDGGLRICEDWDSQRCADVCEAVGNFLKNQGVYHGEDTEVRGVFFNGRSIFHLDRVLIVAGQDNTETGKVEFEYGIVPVPKYDLSQENYKTNLGNSFSLYAINSNSKKASVAATTLEAMASENYRSVTPAVFEVAMKVRYSSDAQSSRMYDILRSTVSFDMGRLCSAHFSNYTTKTFRNSALENPSGFLTLLNSRKKGIEKSLDKLLIDLTK
jgi:hypothetical protein